MGVERAKESAGYNVALRSKETAVITWMCYRNKAEFVANRSMLEQREEVIGHGITEEQCIALVRTTPDDAYTKHAFLNATDPEGKIHFDLLAHELDKSAFAIALKNKR